MRTAFVNTLTKLAREDERIFLLTGDLGFTVFENFREEFPRRFINAGVAEQNMMGMAAGLALSGKIVFAYSIVPFATMRAFEQIRDDICYHQANVKIVGVGGGYSYGTMGATHHAIEDIAIMRVLPNMRVIAPGDPVEVEAATRAIAAAEGPFYLRLGKRGEPELHSRPLNFEIGKGILLKDGNDAALIATGNLLENALKAAQILAQDGVAARVISMPTVKPLDEALVRTAVEDTKAVFTVEEHSLYGGLGSAVAEVVAALGERVLFARIAAPDAFTKIAGSQEYLREHWGLSASKIAARVRAVLQGARV